MSPASPGCFPASARRRTFSPPIQTCPPPAPTTVWWVTSWVSPAGSPPWPSSTPGIRRSSRSTTSACPGWGRQRWRSVLTVLVNHLLRSGHPPAAATTLLVALGTLHGAWSPAIIAVGVVLLVRWGRAQASAGDGPEREDRRGDDEKRRRQFHLRLLLDGLQPHRAASDGRPEG